MFLLTFKFLRICLSIQNCWRKTPAYLTETYSAIIQRLPNTSKVIFIQRLYNDCHTPANQATNKEGSYVTVHKGGVKNEIADLQTDPITGSQLKSTKNVFLVEETKRKPQYFRGKTKIWDKGSKVRTKAD